MFIEPYSLGVSTKHPSTGVNSSLSLRNYHKFTERTDILLSQTMLCCKRSSHDGNANTLLISTIYLIHVSIIALPDTRTVLEKLGSEANHTLTARAERLSEILTNDERIRLLRCEV
jgi:hypothetical protein